MTDRERPASERRKRDPFVLVRGKTAYRPITEGELLTLEYAYYNRLDATEVEGGADD